MLLYCGGDFPAAEKAMNVPRSKTLRTYYLKNAYNEIQDYLTK